MVSNGVNTGEKTIPLMAYCYSDAYPAPLVIHSLAHLLASGGGPD